MLTEARLEVLREAAIPLLDGVAGDYDPLLQVADGASVLVFGVRWRGSHELFRARVELTKRMIMDMGFSSVVLDEPIDVVHTIDEYLMGRATMNPVAQAPVESPAPSWTWHNAEMFDFLSGLRSYNDMFESERHKVRVSVVGHQLHKRSVIWADWESLALERTGIGRRARERLGRQAVLVGFTTSSGTTLTDNRGTPVPTAVHVESPDSVEAMLHELHIYPFILRLRDAPERIADVFHGTPAEHMDALIHFQKTRALETLMT